MQLLLWLAILIAVVLTFASWYRRWRQVHKRQAQITWANQLLTRAQAHILTRDYAQAEAILMTAVPTARQSQCELLAAEGYFMWAQIKEGRGEIEQACLLLDKALSMRLLWEHEKPDFAKLIETRLHDLRNR